jgi:hypothetical protein
MYETELRLDAQRLSDMLDAAAHSAEQRADSEIRTAAASAAIKAIVNLSARDVCNVIEALHCAANRASLGGLSDEADTGIEFLMDAHNVFERIAERQEAA